MAYSRKWFSLRNALWWCGLLGAWVLTALPLRAGGTTKTPPLLTTNNIHSIVTSGNTVVIEVVVPAGTNQVVLQSQPSDSSGGWKPLAVQRITGAAREIVFKVAKGKTKTTYRALIQPVPLPAKFYKGRSSFPPAKGSSGSLALMGGTLAAPVASSSSQNLPASTTTTASAPATEAGTESDIWSVDNDRLYFYNQYRGLQVFDVSNPDSATLLGTLSMVASGEQMYVIDANHVLLLTDDCSGQTGVALVDVISGAPTLITNLSLYGSVASSIQSGTTVYFACTVFDDSTNASGYFTAIEAIDFSNPAAPQMGGSVNFPSYDPMLIVSGNYLLAVGQDTNDYTQSDVGLIDISAGPSSMNFESIIETAGTVQDQFSLNITNNILSAVLAAWGDGPATNYYGEDISVENFSLTNPAAPAYVGGLELGNEQLSAARFDGNRVYIAASYGEASLIIMDLTDPANPMVVGTLGDPTVGQSFIFPLGNQLVAIGPDTNDQTSVSLFDVTHPANCSLLSQVDLGTNYSWSEAEYDVQAFTLLPTNGLIMVPYQTYDPTGAASSGIQLIDLNPASLALRGVIPQAQARRATLLHDRVLSISGTDLLTANISDQDDPVITDDVVLSWPVDQVFLSGSYLLELSTGVDEQTAPVITVASSAAPNVALSEWTLTNSTVLGASLQNGNLYLLQGPVSSYFVVDPIFEMGESSVETNETTLTLSIINLSNLPALSIVGQTNITVTQTPSAGVQAVWPEPETLVWVASAQQAWFWPLAGGKVEPLTPATPVVSPGGAVVSLPGKLGSQTNIPARGGGSTQTTISPGGSTIGTTVVSTSPVGHGARKFAARKPAPRKPRATAKDALALPFEPWFYGSGGIQMYAFDVTDPANPTPASTTAVATNGWPNGNTVFATNGLVYVANSVWGYEAPSPIVPLPALPNPGGLAGGGRVDLVTVVADPALPVNYSYSENTELDVVDFTVPSAPILRAPINIPGALTGISQGGNVVYTVDFDGSLAALAYDGVNVYLIATLPPPTNGFQETLVADETIFTAQFTSTNYTSSELDAWTLSDTGQFSLTGVLPLSQPVYGLANFGNLLGVQAGSGVTLVDFTNASNLSTVGSGTPNGCLWLSLTGATGAIGSGLWVPLGAYGVFPIPATP